MSLDEQREMDYALGALAQKVKDNYVQKLQDWIQQIYDARNTKEQMKLLSFIGLADRKMSGDPEIARLVTKIYQEIELQQSFRNMGRKTYYKRSLRRSEKYVFEVLRLILPENYQVGLDSSLFPEKSKKKSLTQLLAG